MHDKCRVDWVEIGLIIRIKQWKTVFRLLTVKFNLPNWMCIQYIQIQIMVENNNISILVFAGSSI